MNVSHLKAVHELFFVVSFFFEKQHGKILYIFPKRLTQIKDDHARMSLPLVSLLTAIFLAYRRSSQFHLTAVMSQS